MKDFEVVWTDPTRYNFHLVSKVYAVDMTNDTFLIADGWGNFITVDIKDCRLYEEGEE